MDATQSWFHRFRFSLSALLLLVTVTSLFLGYTRFRRQWILREINSLRAEGVQVGIKDTWFDRLWPRASYAYINFVEVSPTHRQLGSQTYEYLKGEGGEYYSSLEKRCFALGVKDVHLTGTTKEKLEELMASRSVD